MEFVKRVEATGTDAVPLRSSAWTWTKDELGVMTSLTGTFVDRLRRWQEMRGELTLDGAVWLLGCGAQGTVLLYCLQWFLAGVSRYIVIDKRSSREEACRDVSKYFRNRVEFREVDVCEDNYKDVFRELAEGDLVVDCSVGVDTVCMIKMCLERGCLYVNSAIEDWQKDGFYQPENEIEESMYYLHGRLHSLESKRGSALVSMGCNPGSVSVWLKGGLEFVSALKRPDLRCGYGERARLLGLETVHVSECDTQYCKVQRPVGEYWNTWSTDSAAFYKEGVGPSETGWGSHETKGGDVVFETEGFRVWKTPGFCMTCETVLPVAGRVRGMIVRHDESYTIAKYLSSPGWSPSVYYVYRPSDATVDSVQELKRTQKAPELYRLMTDCIEEGRDEVGLSLFFRGGRGLWVGSELSIEDSRKLFGGRLDRWINATISQVMGGYIAGVAWLLSNKRRGVMDPEEIPVEFGFRYGGPLWGPVVVMPFTSPFESNRIEDMGLEEESCRVK